MHTHSQFQISRRDNCAVPLDVWRSIGAYVGATTYNSIKCLNKETNTLSPFLLPVANVFTFRLRVWKKMDRDAICELSWLKGRWTLTCRTVQTNENRDATIDITIFLFPSIFWDKCNTRMFKSNSGATIMVHPSSTGKDIHITTECSPWSVSLTFANDITMLLDS